VTFLILIRQQSETFRWVAEMADIPGVRGIADTPEDAKQQLIDLLTVMVADRFCGHYLA
jgi:predicted RNase H-like HicB family nuclease